MYIHIDTYISISGFSVDLLREVARMAGFKYSLMHSENGVYGVYDEKAENWTGLMGLLINRVYIKTF